MRFQSLERRTPCRRAVVAAAAAVLLAAGLTACGDDAEPPGASEPESQSVEPDSPSPSETPSPSESSEPPSPSESTSESASEGPVLEVEVEGGEVTPVAQRVDLPAGETLTITVEADRPGELHVHSDPEQTLRFGAGTTRFRLTLDTPGSVDVEEHEADALVARVLVR